MVSDAANKSRKTRKKKSSAVPPFRSGHMSAICARLTDKGKVGVQRGRETAGVPSFLPLPRGAANPRAPQSATLRLISSEYLPPVRGEPACGSSRAPLNLCRKKGAARIGRIANATRVPRSSGAGKKSRPDGSHLPGQAVKFPLDIPQSPATILLRKRSN